MKIGVYTSISPSHRSGDMQEISARSWIDFGFEYTTINSKSDNVSPPDGGKIILTEKTGLHLYGKPYIFIDSLLDQAILDDVDFAIITNSDIELRGNPIPQILKSRDGLVISKRWDWNNQMISTSPYEGGFDVFVIEKNFLKSWPISNFVLGQPWWDYWIPYWMIKSGNIVYENDNPIYYHKIHQTQYDTNQWLDLGKYFEEISGCPKYGNPHLTAKYILGLIKEKVTGLMHMRTQPWHPLP
jgi:hypothetical protein